MLSFLYLFFMMRQGPGGGISRGAHGSCRLGAANCALAAVLVRHVSSLLIGVDPATWRLSEV